MRDNRSPIVSAAPSKDDRPAHRHWGGFLVSGLLAFTTDALVLEATVRYFGATPMLARLVAITCAMVIGWLAHRRWTFFIPSPPTLREFLRYALAGWIAALMNYTLFALQLLFLPDLPRLVALVIASAFSMIFSYLAMRYAIFARR